MFEAHFQTFEEPEGGVALSARLAAFREELIRRNLTGFVVPRADQQQNEYVAPSEERLAWLTGFTGSAGLAVILKDKAAVFVDGRYTLQAAKQVDTAAWAVESLVEPPPEKWLETHLTAGDRLGFDPWLHTSVRWLSNIQVRSRGDFVGREYVNWWLLYLLLITCIPLSTIVVGRFASLPPAVWLYAGNTLLIAAVSYRLIKITPELEPGGHLQDRQLSLRLLALSSCLAIALSFIEPRWALWGFALNFAVPLMRKRAPRAASPQN